MRACAAIVLLASTLLSQPHRTPVTLDEVITLIATQVPPDDLVAKLRKDGVAFPPTPAIRRHLRLAGLDDATVGRIFPPATEAPRTEVLGVGLSLALPHDWTLKGENGAWTVAIPNVPPALRCDIIVRTWDLGSDARMDRDPKRKVLSDLLPAQTRALIERGFEGTPAKPLAGRGITGVRARLSRSRVGELPASIDVVLFSRRDRVMLVRAHLVGPPDDPWLRQARSHIATMLSGVAPAPGPLPVHVGGTRILVRTATEQFVVDRNGGRSEIPTVPRKRSLVGDPLCVAAPWDNSTRTDVAAKTFSAERLGPTRHVDVVSDPGSDHVLCAVASDHYPVPGQPGSSVSAGRLVYVPPAEGPERPLLVRNRPTAGLPVIGRPRFLPSGHEIVFVDPDRGLCVIPRDGGLPVVLVTGPILVAEPWIRAG